MCVSLWAVRPVSPAEDLDPPPFGDAWDVEVGMVVNKDEVEIIGLADDKKTAVWEDPLSSIRGQYTPGVDF